MGSRSSTKIKTAIVYNAFKKYRVMMTLFLPNKGNVNTNIKIISGLAARDMYA